MPIYRVGKDKKVICTLIKKKKRNTIYKVKGSEIELFMCRVFTSKKEYDILPHLPQLMFDLRTKLYKYIALHNKITLNDNKYIYIWIEQEDIKKYVNSILFSDIKEHINKIGCIESFKLYETFTNIKIDYDTWNAILNSEQKSKDMFADILIGITTIDTITDNDDLNIKVVQIKYSDKEKRYNIDGKEYNKDCTVYVPSDPDWKTIHTVNN
jgi:hypothetical protein